MSRGDRKNKKRTVVTTEVKKVVKVGPRVQKASNTRMDRAIKGLTCMESAVINPFSESVEGCRVDDAYGLPTRTDHLRQSWSLENTATGAGNGRFALFPSATMSGITDANVQVIGAANVNALSDSGAVYGATTEAAFGGSMAFTRQVAIGYKLRNMLNFSTVTGKVQVAPFVMGPQYMNQPWLTANAGSTSFNQAMVYLANGLNPTNVMNMPGAREYMFDELIGKEILLSCRPCGPTANRWKSCSTTTAINATSNYQNGPDITNNATGLPVNPDPCETGNCQDWLGWVVQVIGVPTTTNLNLLGIELMYHYESQPITGNGSALIPTAAPEKKSFLSYEQQIKRIINIPAVQLIGTQVGGMLSRVAGEYVERATGGAIPRKMLQIGY